MIGQIDPNSREVTIVGAGVSGLLVAYTLDRAGFEVTLIEKAARAGGLISTSRTEIGIAEAAAHSFLVSEPVRELCEELGVELVPVREDSRARYILRGGRLCKFPLTILETIQALFRAYFMLGKGGDTDLSSWTRRHLGSGVLEYAVAPMVTGIYGAKPEELSVSAAFPALAVPKGHSLISLQLAKFRQRWRDRGAKPKKSKKPMMAPRKGMGELVAALERRMERNLGARFRRGEDAGALPTSGNVVLAVPAYEAARLLQPVDRALSDALAGLRYSPLVSATVHALCADFERRPQGVGVLIPASENKSSLGILFNSSAFEGRVADSSTWLSLTVMLGGTYRPAMVDRPDEDVQAMIREDLSAVLGFKGDGTAKVRVYRWKKAIPLYNTDLIECGRLARAGWCSVPGRILAGNYTGQVSLRGMIEDCADLAMRLQTLTYTDESRRKGSS